MEFVSNFAATNLKATYNMATITLQYDGRSVSAKRLVEFLRTLSFVKVNDGESPEYDPEMVAKVKRGQEAFRRGDYKIIKTEDLWK